jgi:hypothetical protein
MAVRPIATNQQDEQLLRGTGKMGSVNTWMQSDPVAHYYQRLKDQGNTYLRDDMWAEAARRGESASLINMLQQQKNVEKNTYFDRWDSYGDLSDYDGYMLALSMPLLDNEKKIDRIDDNTGTSYGEYTDREFAAKILDHQFAGYDAAQIEKDKETANFFVKAGAYLASGVNRLAAGAMSFVNDIWNLGEGVVYLLSGEHFLKAFDDNQSTSPFGDLADYFKFVAYDYERRFTGIVNAEAAHEEGFALGTEGDYLQRVNETVGIGQGTVSWGRWWQAGIDSIGYMLPSMLVGNLAGAGAAASKAGSVGSKVLGAISKGQQYLFYAGIMSGNMKDTVETNAMNGISYEDLNGFKVLANAALKAGAQLAVEKVLGLLIGFSGLDRMMGVATRGSRAAGKAITTGNKIISSSIVKALGRGAKDMFKEGLEEVFQDITDGLIDVAFGDSGLYRERGMQSLNVQNLVDSFVVGALVSGVTGVIKSASVVLPANREIGVKQGGELYRMGAFETLNFRDALATMNEWSETLRDSKASEQAKADAAFKMSISMATVGDVLKYMGMERSLAANDTLIGMLEIEAQRESALGKLSDVGYANQLFEDFKVAHKEASAKFVSEQIEQKIKKQLAKEAKKLKKKGVTKIDNVITTKTEVNDPNIPLVDTEIEKVKSALSKIGAVAIIGTDGNIISKSSDIVFVDNKLIQKGDITEIIKGIAYEQVQSTVSAALTQTQKNLLKQQYEKIVGTEGTLDEALTALLFDRNFYAYMLMVSGERRYKMESIQVLAKIDQLVKARVSSDLMNGAVQDAAYKKLIEKVQDNMRAGLVSFATRYQKLDLGQIGNDVITPEMKEAITTHRNYLFTEVVDNGLESKENIAPRPKEIKDFDRYLHKFIGKLTADQAADIKNLARSTKYNDRVAAYIWLTQLAKSGRQYQDKLIYLPSDPYDISEAAHITTIEEFFGASWTDLIDGTYDVNLLKREAIDFINANGYDMDLKMSRLAAIREVLFNKSAKTLTVNSNGVLLKVLDKNSFLKDNFLVGTGSAVLKRGIDNGKIKTLQDISKVKLPDSLGKIKIRIDQTLKPGTGYYVDGGTEIVISNSNLVPAIMHEATHATQFELAIFPDLNIQGGSSVEFELLPKEVGDDLDNYLKTNFKSLYDYMRQIKATFPQMVYFMLAGEVQANSTLSNHMFETGFTFNGDRTELISPDGLKRWKMAPATDKKKAQAINRITKTPQTQTQPKTSGLDNLLSKVKATPTKKTVDKTGKINEDAPLGPEQTKGLMQNPRVSQFVEGSMFTKDGSPTIFYRGTRFEDQFSERDVKGAIWLSTNPKAAENYAGDSTMSTTYKNVGEFFRGYISNLKSSDVVVINAKNSRWDELSYKGRSNLSTDEIVNQVIQTQPDKKAVLFKNLVEDYGVSEQEPGDTLALMDKDAIRRVSVEDNGKFVKAWRGHLKENEAIANSSSTQMQHLFDNFTRDYLAGQVNMSEDIETPEEKKRYISNKVASQSNLKYWIKKGKQIQLDPGVRKFVVSTTANFESLPKYLQQKIKGATLTKYDIIHYVSTATDINNETFKAIARDVFDNIELSKITYKDMRSLMREIEELSAAAYTTGRENEIATPEELLNIVNSARQLAGADPEYGKKWLSAVKRSQTVELNINGKRVFVEAHADTKQLNSAFFRHYDGTLNSLRSINNLGKFMSTQQVEQELFENTETGEIGGEGSTKTWNWIDRLKRADIEYEADDVSKSLDQMDRVDKLNELEKYVAGIIGERLNAMPANERNRKMAIATKQLELEISRLHDLSDEEIDKRYLAVLASESMPKGERPVEAIVAKAKNSAPTKKNIKDQLRNLGRTITQRVAGLKTRFNSLSPDVQAQFDPAKKYKLRDNYKTMSETELTQLVGKLQQDAKRLRERISAQDKKCMAELDRAERLAKMAKRLPKTSTPAQVVREAVGPTGEKVDVNQKKTIRQKVQVEYVTKVKEQSFDFITPFESNSLVKKILDTAWSSQRMSEVQGVSTNQTENVAEAKTFFEQNTEAILLATDTQVTEAIEFFTQAVMNGVTEDNYKKYQALKTYFLGYVYGETRAGGRFTNLDHNLKQKLDRFLRKEVTAAGTMLAVWNNIQGLVDPNNVMKNMDMEIDGVILTDDEKDVLFTAATLGDVEAVKSAQKLIIERVMRDRTQKKSILRKITTVRSMAMLSSPITWLRNKVSNIMLKRLNGISSKIGANIFKGKTQESQLKMNANVTPEIQAFISQHFLDNGLFDQIISNLSKYNPSDVSKRFKDATGQASKEAIFANMVIKSMYNEYYSQNIFKNKWMQDLHGKLMKMLSDNSYVREAAIRYFGKTIAEKKHDISPDKETGERVVSDAIMNDFAVSVGLALQDYMHSDNIMNKIESEISKRGGEAGVFVWKTFLPFASASWQWFKAGLRYSPAGLVKSIFDIHNLEKRINKAEARWAAGESQVSPEMTEFLIRRNLGAGVIGTISWGLGAMLAGMGFIKLREDDYGKPKIVIGNLEIDVSSIFGSSSILAGAAFINGLQAKGWTLDGMLEGLNNMTDMYLDGLFLMDIVGMDMYGQGGFNIGLDQLEQIALSFIPNGLNWLAGVTYSGTLQKDTFWGRAAAKIPFLASIVNEKKVNPYTGDEGSWWDAFNRFVPYLSIKTASENETRSTSLGLNKIMLRGDYVVNDQEFKVDAQTRTKINQAYGQWNAADLEKFYKNKSSHVLMVDGKRRTLTYNQMTESQRKQAVQNIMSNNAERAKILAWTSIGNRYYASANMYQELRRLGITTGVYRGNKGFA